MEENSTVLTEGGTQFVSDTELYELVLTLSDDFHVSVSRVENLLAGQLVGLALVAGALVSLLIVRFFHVR